MHLKDILVHIDNRPTCKTRLEVAIHLAQQHQARLTGLYIIPPPYYASYHTDPQQAADNARTQFETRLAESGVAFEWKCASCLDSNMELPQLLNLYSHYRDLLVVSQTDYEHPDRTIPADLPERAVLGAGRPVLVVPYAGNFSSVGTRIMLGWRGGPESSRALHDAMPLLRSAESVRVISIQGRHGDEAYKAHNADICQHLEHYKIKASGEKLSSGDLSVGDLLLNRIADEGIDLLVIGAFAQTRRGSQTLGEVGRYLLTSMTVPVLMSH